MTASNFAKALQYVFEDEGGFSNDPGDPGGATKYGITHIDLDKWRHVFPTFPRNVRELTKEQAELIYRRAYWNALRCDELPSGVDYCVLDYGINSGIFRSAKVLQSIVAVRQDGAIGPLTLAAVKTASPVILIKAICKERLGFLERLRTWPLFWRGWSRRVNNVQQRALAMSNEKEV